MNFTPAYIKKHTELAAAIKDAINALFEHLKQTFNEPRKHDWLDATQKQVRLLLDSPELTKEALAKHLHEKVATTPFKEATFNEGMALCELLCLKYFYVQQMRALPDQQAYAQITKHSLERLAARIRVLRANNAVDLLETKLKNLAISNVKIKTIVERIDGQIETSLNKETLQTYENELKTAKEAFVTISEALNTLTTTATAEREKLKIYQTQFQAHLNNTDLTPLQTLKANLTENTSYFSRPVAFPKGELDTFVRSLELADKKLQTLVENAFYRTQEDEDCFAAHIALYASTKAYVQTTAQTVKSQEDDLNICAVSPDFLFKKMLTDAYKTLAEALTETPLTLNGLNTRQAEATTVETGFIATVASYISKTPEAAPQPPSAAQALQALLDQLNQTMTALHSTIRSAPMRWLSETVDIPTPNPWDEIELSCAELTVNNTRLIGLKNTLPSNPYVDQTLPSSLKTKHAAAQLQNDIYALLQKANACTTQYQTQLDYRQETQQQLAVLKTDLQKHIDECEVTVSELNARIDHEIQITQLLVEMLGQTEHADKKQRLLTLDAQCKPQNILKDFQKLKRDNQKKSGIKSAQLNKRCAQLTERVNNLSHYISDPKNDYIIDSNGMLTSKGKYDRKIKVRGLLIGAGIGAIIILATALTFATGGLGVAALVPLILLGTSLAPLGWFIGRVWTNSKTRLANKNLPTEATTPDIPLDPRHSPSKTPALRPSTPIAVPVPQTSSEAVKGDNSLSSSSATPLSDEAEPEDTFKSDAESPRFGRTG